MTDETDPAKKREAMKRRMEALVAEMAKEEAEARAAAKPMHPYDLEKRLLHLEQQLTGTRVALGHAIGWLAQSDRERAQRIANILNEISHDPSTTLYGKKVHAEASVVWRNPNYGPGPTPKPKEKTWSAWLKSFVLGR